uniref:PUM-HD domain-containing protein n=1 Tax=Strongyloides venezuelensis TaxID=75913 RepID=A0A0K0FAY5_STRVS
MSIPPEAFTSYMNSINAPTPRELENNHFFGSKKELKSMEGTPSENITFTDSKKDLVKESLCSNGVEENGWEHVSQKTKKPTNVIPRSSTTDSYTAKKIIRTNHALNHNWRDSSNGFIDREKKSFRCTEKFFAGKCGIMQSELDNNWRADSKKNVETNIFSSTHQQNSNKETSYAKESGLMNNDRNWNKESLINNEMKESSDSNIDDHSKSNSIHSQREVYKNTIRNEIKPINSHSEFDPLNSSLDNIFHSNDSRLHLDALSGPLSNINSNVGFQNNVNAFDTLFQSLNINNGKLQYSESFSNNLVFPENDTTAPIQLNNVFDAFKDNLDVSNDYLSQIPMQLAGNEDFPQQNNTITTNTTLGHSDFSPGHMGSYLDTVRINQAFNDTRKISNDIMSNVPKGMDINQHLVSSNLFTIPQVGVANNNPMQNLPEQLLQNFNVNQQQQIPPHSPLNGSSMFMNNAVNNYLGLLNLGITEKMIQSLFQVDAFSQLLQCTGWFTQRENLRWICVNDIGDVKGPFCAQDLVFKLINFHIPPLLKFHCEQLPFKGWLTLVELIRAADDRIPFISAYFPRTREEYIIIQKILKGVGEVPNSTKWLLFFQNEEKIMKQASHLFEAHIAQIVANLRTNPVLQKSNLQLTTEQFKAYVNTNFLTQQYQKDKNKGGNIHQQQQLNCEDVSRSQGFSHNANFNSDLQTANNQHDLNGGGKVMNNSANNLEIQQGVENHDTNQQHKHHHQSINKLSPRKKSLGDSKEHEIPSFHCGTWVPQNAKRKVSSKSSTHTNNISNGVHQHSEYHGRTNVQRPTLLSSSKNWESPNIKPDDDTPAGKVPIGLSLGEFLAPATGQVIERPSHHTPNTRQHNINNNYNWNNSVDNRSSTNLQAKQPESIVNERTIVSLTVPSRPVGAVWKNDNKSNGNSNGKGSSSSKNNNGTSTFGPEEATTELRQWLLEKLKTFKSESDVMAFCQFITNVDNPADIEDYFSTNFGDSVDVRKIYRQYLEKRNEVRSRVIKAKSGQDDLSAPAQAIGFTSQPVKKNKKKSG